MSSCTEASLSARVKVAPKMIAALAALSSDTKARDASIVFLFSLVYAIAK